MRDLLGHILVVAGHDDHRETVLLERVENRRNPSLGGSRKAAKPANLMSLSAVVV